MDYKPFFLDVLGRAAVMAREQFGKVSGSVKAEDNNQVLTQTDIEVGKLIVGKIQEKFSDYNIIDEEAGIVDKQSRYTWVVDPIDGTSNFAAGLPYYGIMLGLLDDATPIAGAIALPYFNEICWAEKGKGAFCNDEKIHVAAEDKLYNVLVAYGIDGHRDNPTFTKYECASLADIVLNVRNLRSSNSGYDAVMVARGKYGAWLNRTSKIWDNVGLQVIVEEAGGVYTDFFGKPMDYRTPMFRVNDNYTACAASPELHNQLQFIINHPTR